MNEQHAPGGAFDDAGPESPKRKKVRAKYAPKACVGCRRSKLKCSGANPCRRCLDNGRRCFYSEDQTAAEALQNLSRPAPAQPPNPPSNGNGNGGGSVRRAPAPRGEAFERRASNSSALSISMEARMARIEGMMEALIQDRGIDMTPRGSMERDGSTGDADTDAYSANLVPVRQQLGIEDICPELLPPPPPTTARLTMSTEPLSTIRIGSRSLPFPGPNDYRRYIDGFFADVNPYHPCIHQDSFRTRSEEMFASNLVHDSDSILMALIYIMFACVDIVFDANPSDPQSKLPGWQWYQMADELVGKHRLAGSGDLAIIQFLVCEASYLTSADRPKMAYNVIGLACRLCFQLGLHQQRQWSNCTPLERHMRQRIFWTVYFLDRRISLSCGRPYGIRDFDIDVPTPFETQDRVLFPGQTPPEDDFSKTSNMLLHAMISWGRLIGEIHDQLFAPSTGQHGVDGHNPEHLAILDARIKHWVEVIQPTIPQLPPDHMPDVRHRRQLVLIHTRFTHLRLTLRRQAAVSLNYDETIGRLCGDLALDVVECMKSHSLETKIPSPFRFHMATTISCAILVLSGLLVCDLGSIGLQDKAPAYTEAFHTAVAILDELALYLHVAHRVANDMRQIIAAVTAIINGGPPDMIPNDIRKVFPSCAVDFMPPAGMSHAAGAAGAWNGDEGGNLESWDLELQNEFGVPWI